MHQLTTRHPIKVKNYLATLHKYYREHNIAKHAQALYNTAADATETWTDTRQQLYDNLDIDITRGKLSAEAASIYYTHSRPWSPKLRNAGIKV